MADMTLAEISERMRDIDFCMLSTRTDGGQLSSRPMSNNREVDYQGDSWFFAFDSARFVADIGKDAKVGLTFSGAPSLLGKPGIFIGIAGTATISRDKAAFAEHWNADLERWFEQGIDTPGMVLLRIHADRVHYWDGEENGDVKVG